MYTTKILVGLLASIATITPTMAGRLQSIKGRETTDICNNVDTTLTALGGLVSVPINVCLCLGGIAGFLANPILAPLLAVVNQVDITSQLASLVSGAGAQNCVYPDNSIPQCTTANVCAFACAPGFILCNGQCIASTTGICPSAIPGGAGRRRSLSDPCPKMGEIACGVLGRGPRDWECVNVKTDLESCGGCMISLLPHLDPPKGRDCTTIPDVSSVGCVRGKCQIESCNAGFKPSDDGQHCVPVTKDSYNIQLPF